MHCLDLISGPPKFFIFQKESNKTNLGGVLFFNYFLIVIFICIFYFYRFSKVEKYSFSSNVIEEIFITQDEVNKRKKSSYYNPAFDFSFELVNFYDKNISSNFFIYEPNPNGEITIIERNKWYKKNVDNNEFIIFYNCNPKNCSTIKESDLFPTLYEYYFTLRYKGPFLDHYDKYPINNIVDKGDNDSYIIEQYPFYYNTPIHYNIGWETIEYNDQIGIFDKLFDKKRKSKYIGGSFKLYSKSIINEFYNPYFDLEKKYNLKLLSIIDFHSNVEKKIIYSRKEKSLIDVIANICSLSLSIFHSLNIIFSKIYSKSFDSFKIIQKILDNNNSSENPSHIELNSILKEKDSFMPLSNNDDIHLQSTIINEITPDDESLKSNFIQNKEMEKYDNLNEKSIKMPKLQLSDYLLNNVYNLKNWKSIKQEVITLCKEILLKYFSVERLLYNQIKLENLFLDYKWNNPNLKYIKNNEYIDKLKNKLNELNI